MSVHRFWQPLFLIWFVCFCSSRMSLAQIPENGKFLWRVGEPFLAINADRLPQSEEHPWIAVKDPSIVRHGGKWHLLCTLRKNKQGEGRIRIGHLSFADWADAKNADWHVLNLTLGYHGAPQIFFFEPHQKWYLIYQAADPKRGLKYGPCFSVNEDISRPDQWSLPEPMYVVPDGDKAGLDYWLICDKTHAHLFFTTLNGKMWRAQTRLDQFPDAGWSKPIVALQADIFEASHTYSLKGLDQFLTIVEAQGDRRRYFKGFIANSLSGSWKPLAASPQNPLVSPINVVNQFESWATSYSHGEFIREGCDQSMTLDPKQMQLLFQGASDSEYRSPTYGQIPWRLGILEQVVDDATR